MTRAVLLLSLFVAMLAGCASRQPAPVSDRTPAQARAVPPAAAPPKPVPRVEAARPDSYVVKPGDTLYSIAVDNRLDYRELAAWNNLENASSIRVGQRLRLTAPPSAVSIAPLKPRGDSVESRPLDSRAAVTKPAGPVPPAVAAPPNAAPAVERVKSGPKATRVPYSDQAWAQANRTEPSSLAKADLKPEPQAEAKREPDAEPKAQKPDDKSESARAAGAGNWTWPSNGKVITTFNGSTSKGIDIAGKLGQPVVAAAAGRVIFSGMGPRGLGKFIVIRHNNDYISIYANNKDLLVKEGQQVARGQQIAQMGDTEADQVKLHFEIRHFSKPVDPITLLPDRG